MSTEKFISEHYPVLAALAVAMAILSIAAVKMYSTAKRVLKKKTAENKHLLSLVEEYQGDQTAALEHLTSAKDKAIKNLRIQHAKWREDTRAKNIKQIEELKAQHEAELAETKKQLQTITELKWANAAMLVDLDKKHQAATAAGLAEIEAKHQEALEERQHQFESKRVQYANFFKLLDQYDLDCEMRMQNILPILNEFQRNYIRAIDHRNTKNGANAVRVATKKLEKLSTESQLALAKIKDEMTAIQLIASEAGVQKTEQLADLYDNHAYILWGMLKDFVPNILAQKNDKILAAEDYLETAEATIHAEREAFVKFVREEMGEA